MKMYKDAEEKNENKHTNVSLIYYGLRWLYLALCSLYTLFILRISSLCLCLDSALIDPLSAYVD
jgi:hypothetical protein